MILQTIIQVAAQCGWSVTANVRDGNITSFDFRRNTESGVPFCFSADMTGSKPTSLVDDILSFIDAQPDIFARQWCRISGAGEKPICPNTLRHGRHTHPGMATRHRPLRSLRRSAPLAVVSLELTVPFYRFFRFLPRLTCGWSSRKIMSLPSISLCQPFSERRYGRYRGRLPHVFVNRCMAYAEQFSCRHHRI